jgi:hypothetical protein
MTSKDTVRLYQSAIARHAADHSRAVARLRQAVARRAQLAAAQDEAVATAQHAVDQTVIGMAHALGVDLTADLLDLDVGEVRRLVRPSRSAS